MQPIRTKTWEGYWTYHLLREACKPYTAYSFDKGRLSHIPAEHWTELEGLNLIERKTTADTVYVRIIDRDQRYVYHHCPPKKK